MSIQVNDFKYIPGENDAEYIKLLKRALARQQQITSNAIAKIKAMIKSGQMWTPVSEGLPEEDGEYLVTYEKGYAEDYGFDLVGIAPFEVDAEEFGVWNPHYDPVTLGYLDSDWVNIPVTAWMPLPECYKGDEK